MILSLRGMDLPSPYFFAPINTGFGINGVPDDRLVRFHAERSGKGIGISYVGNVAIGEPFRSNAQTLVLKDELSPWMALANTIRGEGSLPGIQIACKLPSDAPTRKWKNPSIEEYVIRAREQLLALPREDIVEICNSFIRAAVRAYESGFQVAQIHSAHGYFLSQLLTPMLNHRTDEFSSISIAAVENIVEGIRRAVPKLAIDIRLSLLDGLEPEAKEQEVRFGQIERIVSLGVDLISLSSGHYETNRFLIYPKPDAGHAAYLPSVRVLADRFPSQIWNVAGNIWGMAKIPASPANVTFGIGRPLIADPAFVQKSLEGREIDITTCVRAGHCHYYTRGRPHIECQVNPNL